MDRIVVGIDGSPHAARAVRWARDEARAHGAILQVVMAWHWGDQRHVDPDAPFDPTYDQEAARETLEAFVAQALGDDLDGVEAVAVLDLPARALLEQAEDADLVVVGSRGRGGFAGLMLGSVSQQVMTHAPCPTVVVPDR
ncbi:universal stress protein [Salsipaludibacter albus]|uniref:universal stress protein n=1 Tax=Salsipaludibacter albus TaxID=2849650 RepID=UPI001EE3C3A0|nr:universal stress protein [Salsipaludibacter albus]MBY5162776.1 universal stress protein [Salsipaludibacter albus]